MAQRMIVSCGVLAVVGLGASSAIAGTRCNPGADSLRTACSSRPDSFPFQSDGRQPAHARAAARSPLAAPVAPRLLAGPGSTSPLSGGLPPAGGLGAFGSALVGSAPTGTGPSTIAVDSARHTIYVANGFNTNGPDAGGNTVSVIDERHCRAQDVSRCKGPWPTITVGNLPSTIAIDEPTDTVYVTNKGDNTVSVFNGAICNALNTSGCGQTPATVPVGLGPLGILADSANHTVYIGNFDNGGPSTTVSMLDSTTCNATDLDGCPTTSLPTVDVGSPPDDVAVNQATHTVYVTTLAGWSVFDANNCNATVLSGCGTIGKLTGDPSGPNSGKVDTATNTLYTANYDLTASAFDLRHCNANDLAGCAAQTPGTVTVTSPGYNQDLWVAVDSALHTVYVVNQREDNLAVIDTNICNGRHLSACAALRPPTIHTGADPESVVLDQTTQTLYTANEVDNTVSVIDASRCDAAITRGCRHLPPLVPITGPGAVAVDSATHTAFVAQPYSQAAIFVSMINTRTCNIHRPAGCTEPPPKVKVGETPDAIAVDRRTHTVYVANFGAGTTGTVSVINARTCNATDSTGCANLATLQVPTGNPNDIAVNAATDTIYVATLTSSGPDIVSVFNGTTCNAINTNGCPQTPASLEVGRSSDGQSNLSLAVNQATNTVYATNIVYPPVGQAIGNSVYVINGATCDAANTTGCGQTPTSVTVGLNPLGIAVDRATNTIYAANVADYEHPGTVSVINGATCNGTNTSGCGQTPPTVTVGWAASGVAIDPATQKVYVTNYEDGSVSVINGATCNASDTTGCAKTPPKLAAADNPGAIAADHAAGSAYVTSNQDAVAVIPLGGEGGAPSP